MHVHSTKPMKASPGYPNHCRLRSRYPSPKNVDRRRESDRERRTVTRYLNGLRPWTPIGTAGLVRDQATAPNGLVATSYGSFGVALAASRARSRPGVKTGRDALELVHAPTGPPSLAASRPPAASPGAVATGARHQAWVARRGRRPKPGDRAGAPIPFRTRIPLREPDP
jgi:hypothetical protein